METGINLELSEAIQNKIELIRIGFEKKRLDQEEKMNIVRLADEVLMELFKTPYGFLVPMDFIESELGMLLLSVKCSFEYYYSTYDMEIIFNKTKSTIYYNSREGKINLMEQGGRYLATEHEVINFLKGKKVSDTEIDDRLRLFWEVKSENIGQKLSKKEFMKRYNEKLESLQQ